MDKVKPTRKTVLFVAIAFSLGVIVEYALHSLTMTRTTYSFETGENILQNSGFEDGSEDEPNYWYPADVSVDNLTMSWDTEIKCNGGRSVYINNTYIYDKTVCNNWAQTINKVPKERTVKLSGWVKTTDAESVVMVIQCWNILDEMVAFGTTQTATEINGTNDWQMYNASVYVPNDTSNVAVRLTLTGTGQVWFDDVKLVIK